MSDPLVSTQWLHERLGAPDIKIIDATWFLPGSDRDPKAEYRLAHIPGAVFFDVDEIADTASPLPHMLPPPEKFASRVKKMGLGDGSTMVIYDAQGVFSAPRVWWTFRAMGHEGVVVLDGGLPKWIAEGRPVEDMPTATPGRSTRWRTSRGRSSSTSTRSPTRSLPCPTCCRRRRSSLRG